MIGFPKPPSRLQERMRRQHDKRALQFAFVQAVWKRDEGKCRRCDRRVFRTLCLEPRRGEVHHRRGRNVAPEDRFNPDAAVLLCAECHEKVQLRKVPCPQ